jgi:hypothetical protein
MALEEVGQVQNWFFENPLFTEQERNQQPTNASVAIEKRMNRLKLGVRQADFDEQRKPAVGMQKLFQIRQMVGNRVRRRWYERGLIQGASVLLPSELESSW